MRSATLITLLPLLATTITAHPHRHRDDEDHSHHKHSGKPYDITATRGPRASRKSLGFGPTHHQAQFVTDTPVAEADFDQSLLASFDGKIDLGRIAGRFVATLPGLEDAKEGETFYVRKDVSGKVGV